MTSENVEMGEKLRKLSEFVSKGNFEASSLQIDLEESLNKFQGYLAAFLKRNVELESDLIRIKEELNKSLKWSILSQILANFTS